MSTFTKVEAGCVVAPPNLNNTQESLTLGLQAALPDPAQRDWHGEAHDDGSKLGERLEEIFGDSFRDPNLRGRIWRATRRALGCADSSEPIVGRLVYPSGPILEKAVRAVLPNV